MFEGRRDDQKDCSEVTFIKRFIEKPAQLTMFKGIQVVLRSV